MRELAEIVCDPALARVFEHGWQSWSPAGTYPATGTSPRPERPVWQTMAFRPGRPGPEEGFQGEGLLAVDPGDGGAVRIFSAPDPGSEVASIRACPAPGRVVVSADGEVEVAEHADLEGGLADWAERLAERTGARPAAPLGPAWCSWYCYWHEVTAADVEENLAAIDDLGLDVAIVQVDDGWQAEIGDWLEHSPRFGDLAGVAARIRSTGRRAGIWLAPFLAGERSLLVRRHPEWLVGGADAGRNWGQALFALDVTHPGAAAYLRDVFRRLSELGFDYFKIDFLYAGALEGKRHQQASALDAYRDGLLTIRSAVGPGATLLGCGAPLLPTVGLVDAMRISPDIAPHYEPLEGDISQPSGRGALMAGRARAFQHARLWVNDPDCLLARPQMERREEWAAHVAAIGGLAASNDPLRTLDAWGVETTRRLLRPSTCAPLEVAGP